MLSVVALASAPLVSNRNAALIVSGNDRSSMVTDSRPVSCLRSGRAWKCNGRKSDALKSVAVVGLSFFD